MKARIAQLDYLKGIFVLLMVICHNHVIGGNYPHFSRVIYLFHMPALFVISGYLANVDKEPSAFCKGMLRLVVPYTVFETLYVMLIFVLGKVMNASNQIEELTVLVLADKLLLNPIGTYWYLHTLIICMAVYYLVCHVLKLKGISALAVMGTLLYGLSLVIGRLEMFNIIYFLIGVFITMSGRSFITLITPSVFAAVPLFILILFSDGNGRGSLACVAITILVISLFLFVYDHCWQKGRDTLAYLGRNSLALVVFSPIFTVIGNKLIPYFSFDPTHLLFTFVSLAITVVGCILCAWISDKLGLSKFLFCKERFYSKCKC